MDILNCPVQSNEGWFFILILFIKIIHFKYLCTAYKSNVSCDFCARQFDTTAEKNAHILEHFEHHICQRCEQNLIRIGENFYILHATRTCISSTFKQEIELDEQNGIESSIQQFAEKQETTVHIDESSSTFSMCETNKQNEQVNPQTVGDETNIKYELDAEVLESTPLPESQVVAFDLPERSSKQHPCDYDGCDAKLTSKNRRVHYAGKHPNTRLECEYCGKVFPTIAQIRQHMISHDVQKTYKCSKCGSSYLSKNSFKRHHQNPNFMCRECGVRFCKIIQLKEHYKQHAGANPYDGIDLASKLSIKQLTAARRNVTKKECPIDGCSEMVNSAGKHYHLATKHKLFQFECDLCSKIFPSLYSIRLHMNVHGATSKRYTCDVCGTSNICKGTMQRQHYKQNVVCPWCDRRFCLRKNLKQHQIVDRCGPEKPISQSKVNRMIKRFKCKVEGCNEMISTNNRFYHMARKHKSKSEQFHCDICHKYFATKSGIRFHILRLHVPSSKKFECNLCGRKYLSQSILDWHHKRSHIKEKMFQVE